MESRRAQIVLFYAWQSDWSSASRAIQTAFGRLVEQTAPSWPLVAPLKIVAATDPESGAVRIDVELQRRILEADMFLGDISPVYLFNGRLTPNANVLVETGLALASKEPQAVLLLEKKRDIEDVPGDGGPSKGLPFDIDHIKRIRFDSPSDLRTKLERELPARLKRLGLWRT